MMESHFCLLLFLISTITGQILYTLSPIKCGTNQVHAQCVSTCPASCKDLRYPLPKPHKICSALCRSGCNCAEGYVRSDNGTCVLPEQCCGENEKYKTCGSSCVETCASKPTFCTQQCIAGCFCGCSDYVRENNRTNSPCIPRDECSKDCDDE